jgi:hypothetical protein
MKLPSNYLNIGLAATAVLTLFTACAGDPCIEAATKRVRSPSGRREASVYSGRCPSAQLAPQVLVAFPGGGGGGVFAVGDSVMDVDIRWLSEDSLEVTYASSLRVEKQEHTLRYGSEHLYFVYRTKQPHT